jgi:hypothetical protein
MKAPSRRTAAIVAIGVAAAIGGGGAVAATNLLSPKDQSQAVINDAAKTLGVDPSKLSSALVQAYETQIDQAVAAGQLTQAQGDAMKKALESGNVPLTLTPGAGKGFGFGPGAGVPGFQMRMGFGGLGPALAIGADTAASYLGLTVDELRQQLTSGKTLAQIAVAQGKTVAGLEQALNDAAKTQLDKAVANGDMTAAEEQQALSKISSMIDDAVNGKLPGPGAFGPFGFHGGHGMFHAFGADLSAVATYLGLSEDQLQTQLQSGKTLAQIATAQGKTVAGLEQAMTDAAQKDLDQAVADGKLTKAQEQQILSDISSRIDKIVNGQFPGKFERHWGGPMPVPQATPSNPTTPSAPTTTTSTSPNAAA